MKVGKIKFLLMAVFGCFYAAVAYSATSLFSNYGQIQNVQNYSTNPFWSPNAQYNQKTVPQPIYAQGTSVTTDECINVVQAAVSMQCMARNNCRNTSLSDIRPAVIVQLSNLPNKAYSTACIGYLDTVYESYVAQYGNYAPTKQVAFPTATTPNPSMQQNTAPVIQNPYEIKTPQWKQDIKDRSQELQQLQQQNGAGNNTLSATAFPTTYADLSFTERMQNEAEGYAPFKDVSAYKTINAKDIVEWCSEHSNSAECKKYEEEKRAAAKMASEAAAIAKAENITAEKLAIINTIVSALDPQDDKQKAFLTELVTQYVEKEDKNSSVVLDDKFVYDFVADDNKFNRHKAAIASLSGHAFDENMKVDLDWDDIKIQISAALDASERKRGALVCENNRSLQMGIDTAMWVGTAAAAIMSLGAGGVAGATAKTGISAGLKALAKGAAKVGLKTASKGLVKASKTALANAALKIGLTKSARAATRYGTEKIITRIAIQIGKNLATKRGALLATGAVAGLIYQIKGKQGLADSMSPTGGFTKKAAGFAYSLVNSDLSTTMINCQDLDKGEKCYHVCGSNSGTDDDLNTKVFMPIMGKRYCVDPDDYSLYEVNTKEPLIMNDAQYKKVISTIRSSVADRGHCDWNEDDVDIYFGSYLHDPDTLEPSSELIIEDAMRIDD